MNGTPEDLERQLKRLPRAPLPPELRQRVMTEAVLPEAAPSWRDRAWFSPAWRLAAAGALAALLLVDHWSAGRTPRASSAQDRAAVQAEREMAGLGEELGMPPALVRRMAGQVVPPTIAAGAPDAGELRRLLR